VKVDNLLGPYFYQYKRLSLPGIGLFTLAENAVLPDDNAKVKTAIEGISFSAKTGAELDDSLVMYVKEQTGKMKPLAEADLYSFIATAFQYLNIGKPFYFEGIGTLQKNKDNAYAFTPGTVIATQKADEIPHRHIETKRKSTYDNESPRSSGNMNSGKLVVLLAIVVTLGLVGWGGYYLYNKNTGGTEETTQTSVPPVTSTDTAQNNPVIPDSSGIKPGSNAADTSSKQPPGTALPANTAVTPPVNTPAGAYKFIFETTQKKIRAAKRYEQLKGVSILPQYNNTVAVETKDSLTFNIYTIVNCTPADTARVKEQLNAWYYGGSAIKVKIAQ
jgi:hypothetical protein